jgi:hypothetical protein
MRKTDVSTEISTGVNSIHEFTLIFANLFKIRAATCMICLANHAGASVSEDWWSHLNLIKVTVKNIPTGDSSKFKIHSLNFRI